MFNDLASMGGWGHVVTGIAMLVSVVLLWKGADLFVDSAVQIARRLHLSELTIGLTLVGFGTSAPELAVSVGAALSGQSNISVANIVGSNIFNLGFILGGCAAVTPILVTRRLIYRDGVFLIGVTSLLALLLWDLTLSRSEGVLLLVLLGGYLALLFRDKTPPAPAHASAVEGSRWDWAYALGGLAMILGGAHLMVESASSLARASGMSEWAIGVTIVAAGTSAPELVTALSASLKGRHGISAGALIGSDLYNLLGVLGVAGIIRPLGIDASSRGSVLLLVGMVVLVVVFMRRGWSLSRGEGLTLVGLNLVRWWSDITGTELF